MDQPKFATSRRQRPAELKWLARFWRLHSRLVLSTAFGTAVALTLLALPWGTATRLLVGWDSGVVLYLALVYSYMAHASIARMRQRAAIDDEGAIALLVLTTTAALASLAAVVAEIGQARDPYHVVLGMGTILLSWTFMHRSSPCTMHASSLARVTTSGPAASFFLVRKTRTTGTSFITRSSWP